MDVLVVAGSILFLVVLGFLAVRRGLRKDSGCGCNSCEKTACSSASDHKH